MNPLPRNAGQTLDSSTDLLRPDSVNLRLAGRTAAEAVSELHAGIRKLDAVVDPDALLADLLARQNLGDNCLDAHVALPHVRTTAVNRIVLAIGRSDRGIDFGEGHRSVRLVCLIGAPSKSVMEYLHLTAQLARALRSSVVREALLNAPDTDAFNAVYSLYISRPKA